MGRRKRGSGANELYQRHLQGTPFAPNPINNRMALIERMYQRILAELATNRFKWEGFPSSIDVRFLELQLFYSAISVFYLDKKYDKFLALRGGANGPINMLDNPTSFQVVGNQYVSATVSAVRETADHGIAVPIWANYLRIPDLDIVTIYANRLATLDRTIEINSENARRNKVLVASENTQLSVENINRMIEEGSTIRVNTAIGENINEIITAIDLGSDPDAIEKLHIVRTRQWNECMGLLGIENANQDKKERLVSSEVDANADQTSNMRFVNLNARRIAIEKIKLAYPGQFENLTVDYNTDLERAAMAEVPAVGMGGEQLALPGEISIPDWSTEK